ncbi:MAG: dienelactone hydrolase family protein, partial [Rhodospirillaceae bacterium]|nr:dienelactone hydrolase family protein [Rhodospirillaceae bacterium]
MSAGSRRSTPGARPRALSAALAVLVAGVLGGCGLPPLRSETVQLASADPVFLDAIVDRTPASTRKGKGFLMLPRSGTPPFPAVVILHGAQGQGMQDWHYADVLTGAGFAALAIDSFGPRGIERTVADQTLVTEAQMMADAYAGLAALRRDSRIDPQRIAVLGFSKGGTAALYAALARVRDSLAPDGRGFAAHIAYYPWCGLQPRAPATTGAPVLIQIGKRDDVTPAALCEALVDELRRETPDALIDLVIYPQAEHAFDHPLLAELELDVVGEIPAGCLVREEPDGAFVEQRSGERVTASTLKAVVKACSLPRGHAGGDPA